jgi:hypothetical protein
MYVCIDIDMVENPSLMLNEKRGIGIWDMEHDIAGKSVTAVSRAWGWKTCKTKKLIGKGHRFGAGLGGSDAFVSTHCQRKLESLIL